MTKRRRDYHPYIDNYMDDVRSGKIPACKELKQAMILTGCKNIRDINSSVIY